MLIEERIKACLERHPDWDDRRVANSLSVIRKDIRAVRAGVPIVSNGQAVEAPGGVGLVSLESVMKRYDIKAAILHEIQVLPEGRLISEAELCNRTAGTDKNRFRRTVENNPDALNPLRIKLKLDMANDGKWFWGKAPDVESALKIRDL